MYLGRHISGQDPPWDMVGEDVLGGQDPWTGPTWSVEATDRQTVCARLLQIATACLVGQ